MLINMFLPVTRFAIPQAIKDCPHDNDHDEDHDDTKDKLPTLHLETTLFSDGFASLFYD